MCEQPRFKFCPDCDLEQQLWAFPLETYYTAAGERVRTPGRYCREHKNARARALRAEYRRRYLERQEWLARPPF